TDVSLRFAHVGFLSVINSSGSGVLGMTALHVDQFLTLEQARFAAVGLADARVDLELDLKDSKISYQLQMAGLRVGQDLRMSDVVMGDEAGFAEVVLLNAQVGGSLYLVGSVGTLIQMDGLRVGGDLYIDKAKSKLVSLNGTHVGGVLDLNGAKVSM